MDNKFIALLEINLQLLITNIQLNSLAIKNSQDNDIIQNGHKILKQTIEWLHTVKESHSSDSIIANITERILETVKTIDNNNFHQQEFNPVVMKENNHELLDINSDKRLINESKESVNLPSISFGHEVIIQKEREEVKEEKAIYFKLNTKVDRWDYVNTNKNFMQKYEPFMHFLLPNLFHEVIKELNYWNSTLDPSLLHISIKLPSEQMHNITAKLLREAPGASLLRRIKRVRHDKIIDLEEDSTLTGMECGHVNIIVKKYFSILTKHFDSNQPNLPSVDTLGHKTQSNVEKYSLGPLTIETRMMSIFHKATNQAFKIAESTFKDKKASNEEKVVHFATVQLLVDLSEFILKEKRFLKLLEDLKA